MAKSQTGLRKRQQITHANQMMFLWIAGVSVVVGFALVLMIFLVQKIWYGERVIAEQLNTVSILDKNLSVVDELKNNVRVLGSNQDLQSTRLNDTDSALQSVLDALPADANSTAMASSLQQKILSGVTGVVIESLKVQPVSGLEVAGSKTTNSTSSDPLSNTIGFSFSVSTASANSDALRAILTRLEKSIRPFTIETLVVEGQGSRIVMTATGVGYYLPAQKIQLEKKVVRP